jgi:hypothetical protein
MRFHSESVCSIGQRNGSQSISPERKFLYEHTYCHNDTPIRSGDTVIPQIDTHQGF